MWKWSARTRSAVELHQDFYLEDLPPLAISDERLRQDPKTSLTDGEIAELVGALQWAATQTQIQACARVNLLLAELTVNKNMAVAVEINQLIKDLKKDPTQTRLWQLPHIDHWQHCVVVTMADQAHANRPQGGSTGGVLTCLGGPEQATGDAGKLNTISWRSWRLKRKAISTNDGNVGYAGRRRLQLPRKVHVGTAQWLLCHQRWQHPRQGQQACRLREGHRRH